MVTTPRYGPVERAVRTELKSLRVSVQADGTAALAVALSSQIDGARGAVAAAQAAAQLRQLLIDLRAFAAASSQDKDAIDDLAEDELASRRASR